MVGAAAEPIQVMNLIFLGGWSTTVENFLVGDLPPLDEQTARADVEVEVIEARLQDSKDFIDEDEVDKGPPTRPNSYEKRVIVRESWASSKTRRCSFFRCARQQICHLMSSSTKVLRSQYRYSNRRIEKLLQAQGGQIHS